jgi:hypothetical protein
MRKNRGSISLTKKVIVCAFNGKTNQNLICEGSHFVTVSKLYLRKKNLYLDSFQFNKSMRSKFM